MTAAQKVQLRLSEVRTRLNEIAGLEELDAEIRTEADSLQVEYADLEIRHRAAITGAAGNGTAAVDDGQVQPLDAEEAEIRALVERAELRRYIGAAIQGRSVDGAESELSAARDLPDGSVPWEAIAPRSTDRGAARVEERAGDAATVLPATGPPVMEKDYVGRVFAGGTSSYLGVRIDTVESGEASYFTLGSPSAIPATVAAGAVKDAEAAALTGIVCEPHRLTAAYTMRVEDLARSLRLEDALRMDLSGALTEALDKAVLNGDGAVDGLFDTIADPAAALATVAVMGDFVAASAGGVDGRYARNLLAVRTLVGPLAYGLAASKFTSTGDTTGADYLIRRSGGFQTSALIPAVASGLEQAILSRVGTPGNALVAIWQGLSFSVIRDEFTRASTGEVRLQAIALYDFKVLRAAGFKRIQFRVSK